MKLVVFILNNEELLEQALESYVEAGIQGATILDSEGMGRFLTYEVPLFAEFRQFMKGNKPYNKTIISVVRDESVIPRLRRLLDKTTGGFSTPGSGIFFTVPVDFADGLVEDEPAGQDRVVSADGDPGGQDMRTDEPDRSESDAHEKNSDRTGSM